MVRSWQGRGLAVLVLAALQACGGGGGSEPAATPEKNGDPTPIQTTGRISAVVVDAETGQPLSGASVSIEDKNVATDANGKADLGDRTGTFFTVNAKKDGYAPMQLQTSVNNAVYFYLAPVKSGTVGASAGGSVAAAGTTAAVNLPGNVLVDAQTGAAFTGQARVLLAPIDPSRNVDAMPGNYRTATGSIESFGAVRVSLLDDATGKPLALGKDKTATLRIPVRTRAADLPATMPLYYFDEQAGRWVQSTREAKLVGAGTPLAYYEGLIDRTGTWNADKPMPVVYVSGCLQTTDGKPAVGINVTTQGNNYSASNFTATDASGRFRISVKQDGEALLKALDAKTGATISVPIGASSTDRTLPGACLKLSPAPTQPVIVADLLSDFTVPAGVRMPLFVGAVGVGPLHYQWKRNDQVVGTDSPILILPNVAKATDDNAVYRVVVSNANGQATSHALTLHVVNADLPGFLDAQQQALLRVYGVSLQPLAAALSARELVYEEVLAAPAQACTAGTLKSLSLNGNAVLESKVLQPDTRNIIDVTFDRCAPRGGGMVLTGRNVSDFTYTVNGTDISLHGTATLSDLEMKLPGGSATEALIPFVTSGVFSVDVGGAGDDDTSDVTITPAISASVTSGATGAKMVFQGGAFHQTPGGGGLTYRYDNLLFKVGETLYAFNGQITGAGGVGATSTGTLTLSIVTSGGSTEIARIVGGQLVLQVQVLQPGAIPNF